MKILDLKDSTLEVMPEPVKRLCPYLVDPVIYLILYYFSYKNWESSLVGCVGDITVCFHSTVRRIESMAVSTITAVVF